MALSSRIHPGDITSTSHTREGKGASPIAFTTDRGTRVLPRQELSVGVAKLDGRLGAQCVQLSRDPLGGHGGLRELVPIGRTLVHLPGDRAPGCSNMT